MPARSVPREFYVPGCDISTKFPIGSDWQSVDAYPPSDPLARYRLQVTGRPIYVVASWQIPVLTWAPHSVGPGRPDSVTAAYVHVAYERVETPVQAPTQAQPENG